MSIFRIPRLLRKGRTARSPKFPRSALPASIRTFPPPGKRHVARRPLPDVQRGQAKPRFRARRYTGGGSTRGTGRKPRPAPAMPSSLSAGGGSFPPPRPPSATNGATTPEGGTGKQPAPDPDTASSTESARVSPVRDETDERPDRVDPEGAARHGQARPRHASRAEDRSEQDVPEDRAGRDRLEEGGRNRQGAEEGHARGPDRFPRPSPHPPLPSFPRPPRTERRSWPRGRRSPRRKGGTRGRTSPWGSARG